MQLPFLKLSTIVLDFGGLFVSAEMFNLCLLNHSYRVDNDIWFGLSVLLMTKAKATSLVDYLTNY